MTCSWLAVTTLVAGLGISSAALAEKDPDDAPEEKGGTLITPNIHEGGTGGGHSGRGTGPDVRKVHPNTDNTGRDGGYTKPSGPRDQFGPAIPGGPKPKTGQGAKIQPKT